jgi:hypothetical protein
MGMVKKSLAMRTILLFFFCAYFISCLSLSSQKMTSGIENVSIIKTDKTLHISRIYGGQEQDAVDTPTYLKVLTQTLISSGIFKAIGSKESSDYSLRAIILFQNSHVSGINEDFTLSIKYQIFSHDKKLFWEDIITSTSSSRVGITLAWLKTRAVVEGAINNNLTQFIQELAKLNL